MASIDSPHACIWLLAHDQSVAVIQAAATVAELVVDNVPLIKINVIACSILASLHAVSSWVLSSDSWQTYVLIQFFIVKLSFRSCNVCAIAHITSIHEVWVCLNLLATVSQRRGLLSDADETVVTQILFDARE